MVCSILFHSIIIIVLNNFFQNFAIPIPAVVPFVRNLSFPIPLPARELQCDFINQFQFLLELIPAPVPIKNKTNVTYTSDRPLRDYTRDTVLSKLPGCAKPAR